MSASCYPSVAKKLIFQNFMQRIRFKLVNFSSNAFEWKIDVASLQLKILFYDLCVVHLCMKFACADDWQIVRIFWHILPTPDLTHLHYSFLDLPLFPPKIYSNLFKCWHKTSNSLWHKSFIFLALYEALSWDLEDLFGDIALLTFNMEFNNIIVMIRIKIL